MFSDLKDLVFITVRHDTHSTEITSLLFEFQFFSGLMLYIEVLICDVGQ